MHNFFSLLAFCIRRRGQVSWKMKWRQIILIGEKLAVQLSKAFWAPKLTQTKLICASAELVRPPANCATRSYYAETRQAPQSKYV